MAVTYEQLTSFDFPASERVYEADETMLYALGVGLGHDPVDQKQLRFVTETKLRALPTMATVLVGYHGWTPQVGIDMTAVLHGEQRLRIERPLPPAGEVYDKRTLSGVVDKGPGGPVLLEVTQEIFARPSDERLADAHQCDLRERPMAGFWRTDGIARCAPPRAGRQPGRDRRSAERAPGGAPLSAQRRSQSAAQRSGVRQPGWL